MRKNTMHLFAGAGGGLLGDLILGHTPIIAVEWDKYACKVLRERADDGWFTGLQVYEGDVRLFDPSEYAGRVDCIHAGFPCQDISVAGKQAGVGEDTRSGLYREVLRIADVVRPGELFLENVSAILSNGLGVVLADLSSRGYSARWMCLRASDVGANHHRDRWWLLARRSDVPPHTEHVGIGRREQFAQGAEKTSGCTDIPNTNTQRLQRSVEKPHARPSTPSSQSGLHNGNGNGEESGDAECTVGGLDDGLAFESHVDWWDIEPDVGRVTFDNKDRAAQLKALGNGQVPLQMAVAYSILEDLFNA